MYEEEYKERELKDSNMPAASYNKPVQAQIKTKTRVNWQNYARRSAGSTSVQTYNEGTRKIEPMHTQVTSQRWRQGRCTKRSTKRELNDSNTRNNLLYTNETESDVMLTNNYGIGKLERENTPLHCLPSQMNLPNACKSLRHWADYVTEHAPMPAA